MFELRTSVILFRVLAFRTDRARIAVGRNSSSRHVRMWEFGLSRGLDAESERERERERERLVSHRRAKPCTKLKCWFIRVGG